MQFNFIPLILIFLVSGCKTRSTDGTSEVLAAKAGTPRAVNVIPDTGWYTRASGCDMSLNYITTETNGTLAGFTLTTANDCKTGPAVENLYIHCVNGVCDQGNNGGRSVVAVGFPVILTGKNKFSMEVITVGDSISAGAEGVSLQHEFANFSWARPLSGTSTTRSEGKTLIPETGWYTTEKGCDLSISEIRLDSKKSLAGFTLTNASTCEGSGGAESSYIRCINGNCDQGNNGGRSLVGIGIPIVISAKNIFSQVFLTLGSDSSATGPEGVDFRVNRVKYKWARALK